LTMFVYFNGVYICDLSRLKAETNLQLMLE